MLQIRNRVLACWDGKYRPRMATSTVIVHRIGPELGDSAEDIAKRFRDTRRHAAGSYTGGEFPYHFVVFPDGRCEQSLALMDTGVHAMVWNKRALGVALSGDFHKSDDPTPEQWRSTVNLIGLLGWWLGAYQLLGHTEANALDKATRDPLKACPGAHISMDDLRAQVAARILDVTPEYNKRAKDLVLCCREATGDCGGGYGVVITQRDFVA